MKTKDELIDDLLDLAFAEDLGDGDHTTLSTIPENAMGRSRLIIKEDGILAGGKSGREGAPSRRSFHKDDGNDR